MKKTCKVCNEQKEIIKFHKRWDSKDGYYHQCKECSYKVNRQYKLDRPYKY